PELGLSEDVFAAEEASATTEVLDPTEIAEAEVTVDPDADTPGAPDASAEAPAEAPASAEAPAVAPAFDEAPSEPPAPAADAGSEASSG
ncbi:MAG: hypothetical protein ACJ780_00860, partial [Solirubrobacteraceae bacterium]